ncbi:MAG: acyl-CoA desaturase [Alcanivoracaceae bacterium]|jgi:linoleoyl-CoA desaturase|nr:acyl-CoA desaturase [Alcanivoracaceae bacterium]
MTSILKRSPKANRPGEEQLTAFGAELDALRERTLADLGERDARYIRRIYAAVRYTEVIGRGLLFFGVFPPAWIIGTLLLGISKILDNMELGHNVIHGQYDWMNDPNLNGKTFEWDLVGTSEHWRKTHNYSHHTYTNIKGMDEDIGYGVLRLFPEQRWRPFFLGQPIYALIFALLFQWGVAIQDLRFGQYFKGKKTGREMFDEMKPFLKKTRRQLIKDYVVFPLIAGPFFLPVLLGNLVANGIRNLWTYTIIFCGHFTADVELFPKSVLRNETRGHWYYRQIRGSSNLTGSKLLHVMSGNLSHQIEHHLFPDIPAHRYAEMSLEVRAICQRYGVHYNRGSLVRQFSQVIWRILRYSLPSKYVPIHASA